MVAQTIQFETVSVSEIGSGTITAFLFSGTTLAATLGSIAENGTLKGRNTGVVNDVAAGNYRLVVKFDGCTVSESDTVVDLLLAVGTYVSYRAAVLDSAVGTQITNIENASGYMLAVLAGECADPQTASETYAITVFGSTFTVDMAGQTSTGTRTAPTLTKA
jgi:hypothetical protein